MKTEHCPCAAEIIATALAMAALAGCHSLPPLRYYSLAAAAPATTSAHPHLPMPLRVRHITLPHEMDHLDLTHHVGPTEVAISDNDQWTAPLGTLIQGTIIRDLGERLGYEQVLAADALPQASQALLDLDFVALSADDSCGVTAQVNWTLSVANGAPRRGSLQLMAAAAGCPAGLPTALSQALGQLADQLAKQLPTP